MENETTDNLASQKLYRTRRVYRWALRVLAVLACVLSVLLADQSSRAGMSLPGCGGEESAGSFGLFGGCQTVIQSEWSRWMGVPVAMGGVLAYFGIFIAACCIGPGRKDGVQRKAWRALIALSTLSATSALWFTIVQAAIVDAWCVYCTITHGLGATIALIVLLSGHLGRTRSHPWMVVGLIPTAVLILGQLFFQPEPLSLELTQDPDRPAAGIYQDTDVTGQRRITLLIDKKTVAFNPAGLPTLGSVSAKHLIVHLYDYQCEHCRAMHPMLEAAIDHFGPDTLGIVLIPTPREALCNPRLLITPDGFEGSCELARMFLAMSHQYPEETRAIHHQLMTQPPQQALAKLKKTLPLSQVSRDFAQQQLENNLQLHGLLSPLLPQTIIGPHTLIGRPHSEQQLIDFAANHFNTAQNTDTPEQDSP